MAERVHNADRLRIGIGAVARGGVGGDISVPFAPALLCKLQPACRSLVAAKRRAERFEPQFGIADNGLGEMLGSIMPTGIEADELCVLCKAVQERW